MGILKRSRLSSFLKTNGQLLRSLRSRVSKSTTKNRGRYSEIHSQEKERALVGQFRLLSSVLLRFVDTLPLRFTAQRPLSLMFSPLGRDRGARVANKARFRKLPRLSIKKMDKKGFTLLEVLISLAIIALALTVILKAQFYNLRTCSESKNILIAKMLAQEKIAEVELTEELGGGGGIFPENKDFSWILNSGEVEEGLKKVDLKVTWKEGNLTKDFSVTTYLLWESSES